MNVTVNPEILYFTVDQVAARYGVSSDSIWRWKRKGDCPAPVRIGPNCTRWRLSDLIEHEGQLKACHVWIADWSLVA